MSMRTGKELAQDIGEISNLYGMPVVPSIYTSSQTSSIDDIGRMIIMNSASANSYTILSDGAMARPIPVWQTLTFLQLGAGLTTLVAGGGATVTGQVGVVSAGQYAVFGVMKVAANTWVAFGNLAA